MRIKIADDILDSFRDEIIAQNYGVNEIGDIATRQGGFSNEFTIPLTAKNRDILGIPDDINSTSRNPYIKVDASLVDQGTIVATGYLRFQTVSNNEIKVSFFSDNVEWFSLVKDKSLRDLDLSELDHDWTVANIEAAITADKSSGYTYPLIDYGDFTDLTVLTVESDEMFPAVFISTIVSRMFFEIGWKEDGEMIDHPLYKRMVIPFSGKSFSHTQAYIDDNSLSFDKVLEQTAGPMGTNPAVIIWVDFFQTDLSPVVPGTYDIIVQLEIDDASIPLPPTTYTVEILLNGTPIKTLAGLDTYGSVIAITHEGQFLVTSDVITVELFSVTNNIIIKAPLSNTAFNLLAPISAGSEIQVSSIMPDIKQSDLLNYLAFVFGAVPQANNLSKTVSFGLFRSIKLNIPNALDWSTKIDMSKSESIDFTQLLTKYKSISILRYAEDDNDAELSSYAAETDRTFGDGQLDIDNEHIAGKATIYEAPFSPMININSFDNTMYIPQIRFKVSGGDDLEPEPKIAVLSTNFSVDTLSIGLYSELTINDAEGGASDTVASIPFCWFTKVEYISEIDDLLDSLAFDQILFPNVVGDPLIDRFLADYEEILNSVKFSEAFFHLNETDITGLDFLIPIFVDHYKAYFYISKISNYEGSDKTTKAELVKIADG